MPIPARRHLPARPIADPGDGYRLGMVLTLVIILGVIVAAFIVLGLVWAFAADRRRNEEVAHDTDRLDTEPDPHQP